MLSVANKSFMLSVLVPFANITKLEAQVIEPRNTFRKGMLSTGDLLVVTSLV
jgi:hypothetical protein